MSLFDPPGRVVFILSSHNKVHDTHTSHPGSFLNTHLVTPENPVRGTEGEKDRVSGRGKLTHRVVPTGGPYPDGFF